jgi:oligopeptide transport system ATP-binding protein
VSVPILEVRKLSKEFSSKRIFSAEKEVVKAITSVSFSLQRGEILGIVGESGSGKSTLARCLMRLVEPTSGNIYIEGKDITFLPHKELIDVRKKIQIVFQNPAQSLNPRKTVYDTLSETIFFFKIVKSDEECDSTCKDLLQKVGLAADVLYRFPHELSLGQMQRIALARAISSTPHILILDECVSALDVSVQAQVLNLLLDLHHLFHMSYLFISHDLGVVEYISDKIIVMQKGQVVEAAESSQIFENPKHPYTKRLLSSLLP